MKTYITKRILRLSRSLTSQESKHQSYLPQLMSLYTFVFLFCSFLLDNKATSFSKRRPETPKYTPYKDTKNNPPQTTHYSYFKNSCIHKDMFIELLGFLHTAVFTCLVVHTWKISIWLWDCNKKETSWFMYHLTESIHLRRAIISDPSLVLACPLNPESSDCSSPSNPIKQWSKRVN